MKIVFVAAVMALALATHPVSQSLTDEINSSGASWKAMTPEENPFSYMTVEEIKSILGTKLMATPEIPTKLTAEQVAAAPAEFDFDTAHPECAHPIMDQASCGSCWAFGASEALTDRFCQHTDAAVNVVLSPEDMVECDSLNFGCNGGMMYTAWRYLEKTGVVSDECYSYHSGDGHTEKCHDACDNADQDFKKYKCEAGSTVHPKSVADIKAEISTHGSMELAFTVYEDFMSYRSGVYAHTTGKQLGGHAVKVVGYGSENGVEYWKCANSWNSSWGENGFFKIAIGDSGANDQIYACTPDA